MKVYKRLQKTLSRSTTYLAEDCNLSIHPRTKSAGFSASDYKKIYWDIKLSDSQVEESWKLLNKRISPLPSTAYHLFKYGTVFASLLLILVVGTVGLAQATTPGSTLYPIKVLSDKIVGKISNKPQINIERRSQDLIKASKQQPEKIKEAKKEYHQALQETEKEVENNKQNKEKINNSIEKQEQEFKNAIKENPKSEKDLKEVLNKTIKVKERIKNKGKKL